MCGDEEDGVDNDQLSIKLILHCLFHTFIGKTHQI